MQNINLLFIVQPVIVIAVCLALMFYWRAKRRFRMTVWLFTLVAYFGAIALKYLVQGLTYKPVVDYFGFQSIPTGVYFGLQTMFFEVGLAFVVAWYLVSRGKIERRDAEAYGSGLAFWENAVFLGALSLVNLVTYYLILSTNTPLAQTLYEQLNTNAPALFATSSEALGLVAIGTVERMSSILIHVAWGYLCVMAAVTRNKRLFLIALPMGLIDALVPFAQLSILLFEAVVFALAALSIFAAWLASRGVRKNSEALSHAFNLENATTKQH